MKPQPKMRYAGAFAVLLALLAVLFVWNVNSGSLHLSVREVAQILLTHSGDNAVIVWEIRLPRIFAAILLGGALEQKGISLLKAGTGARLGICQILLLVLREHLGLQYCDSAFVLHLSSSSSVCCPGPPAILP